MIDDLETISISGRPFKECPKCGTNLKFSFSSNPHIFKTLKGKMRTTQAFYDCKNNHRFMIPNPYVLPYKRFGIDVYAEVLYRRFNKKRTQEEIKLDLWEDYKLEISEDSISRIINFFLQLKGGEIDPSDIKEMQKNGYIILSIDGIKPLKGNTSLYIVRDVLTSTTLKADFFTSAENNVLISFLEPLKLQLEQLGLPVKGIISDKEKALVQSIDEVFKGVPHQLCHTHFLDNVTEPAAKLDMHMATQIKKELGKNNYMKETKKKINSRKSKERFRR